MKLINILKEYVDQKHATQVKKDLAAGKSITLLYADTLLPVPGKVVAEYGVDLDLRDPYSFGFDTKAEMAAELKKLIQAVKDKDIQFLKNSPIQGEYYGVDKIPSDAKLKKFYAPGENLNVIWYIPGETTEKQPVPNYDDYNRKFKQFIKKDKSKTLYPYHPKMKDLMPSMRSKWARETEPERNARGYYKMSDAEFELFKKLGLEN